MGVEVDTVTGVADSGRFADDLAAPFEVPGEAARDLGVGALVLIDELGAGLPTLPAQLADATSYAERLYDYRPIGLLDDAAAREALTVPELGGDGPATVADIARAMGKGRTSDISVARVELIKKGLAYAPERGFLAFTVPGRHEFIARQP